MDASEGMVTQIVTRPFKDLDPYQLHLTEQYSTVHQIGEFLVRQDENQQLIPGLAKGWTVSDDRTSIIFHLRSGIYDAEEVQQSLKRMIHQGQTSHSNFSAQIKNITTIDNLNLLIETTGDAGALLSPLVMADAVIVPDSHWKKNGDGREYIDWAMSKGPYRLESGSFPLGDNDTLIFTPNKNHYNYRPGQLKWKILKISNKALATNDIFEIMKLNSPCYLVSRLSQELKFHSNSLPKGINSYDKPNGLGYIQLNQFGSVFSNIENRRMIQKRLFSLDIFLTTGLDRAYQIPQPALVGRMNNIELSAYLEKIRNIGEQKVLSPIKWSIPYGPEINVTWHKKIVELLDIKEDIIKHRVYPTSSEWQDGKIDATFLEVGMSDSDPISSATFIFSPAAGNGDTADGKIMKILNDAKGLNKREVSQVLRKVYEIALDDATIIPLYYTRNRYIYTDDLDLNLAGSDPFAEQLKVQRLQLR